MSASIPTILIIVGITGDLSKRKLLPAIGQIAKAGALPRDFKVVGITRRNVRVEEVLEGIRGDERTLLAERLQMYQMDLASADDYKQLRNHLDKLAHAMGGKAQRLFYLSVPPQISRPIVEHLGAAGLAEDNAKLLLEKPFGSDLYSAQELVQETRQYFSEDQIYRIDHYLAKEMAQNLIVFRQGNSLFKRTWNKDFIEKIEIVASEKIGIEGRAAFYEQTGAMRDLVQSHLLQLAALTLMEIPKAGTIKEVPNRRLAALRQLRIPEPIAEYAVRGQYNGYRIETGNPDSIVETYVDLRLTSSDPVWEGVPIRLVTGKSLNEKATQIRITYKKDEEHEANQLVICLQPDEGVDVRLWTKVPGYEWKVEQHSLGLAFKDHFSTMPEAYEQVIVDAMNANHTLFTTGDEVLESWRIIQPIQQAWELSGDDLVIYEPGSDIGL